jgi:hypothetical protein
MENYCTLFDKNYTLQAVALFQSLRRHTTDFVLYCLCMDDESFAFIRKCGQPDLIAIQVSDLETPEVRAVREQTTHGQFCWVSQPLICEYLLTQKKLPRVTYLEADSMFFADPRIILEEFGDGSVSCVPHRYSPAYAYHLKLSGRYCVQFNTFRNDDNALAVLNYWRQECFKYRKDRPYYLPGQTCLDDWPTKFAGVKEIQQLGAGLAPWNVQQYRLESRDGKISVDGQPLVFFHYHGFARYDNGDWELGYYRLATDVVDLCYRPYVGRLAEAAEWMSGVDAGFQYRRLIRREPLLKKAAAVRSVEDLMMLVRPITRRVRGAYNVYKTL